MDRARTSHRTLSLLLCISLTMIAAACRSDAREEEPGKRGNTVSADPTVETPPQADASVDVKTTGREWSFDAGVAGAIPDGWSLGESNGAGTPALAPIGAALREALAVLT